LPPDEHRLLRNTITTASTATRVTLWGLLGIEQFAANECFLLMLCYLLHLHASLPSLLPPHVLPPTLQAIERHRKEGLEIKCKRCVAIIQAKEQAAAAAKTITKTKDAAAAGDDEMRPCASCEKMLPQQDYNRNQWNKGEGKSRCRMCVERSLQEEAAQQGNKKNALDNKIEEAKQKVVQAKASGDAAAVLRAESVVAALEAEKVTGLRPVRAGGRGPRRGRGRGRR
jgi:hypothetical protein